MDDIISLNFADDKKLATIVRNRSDTDKLQRAIDAFIEWCSSNGLAFNNSKCKIMIFTHKRSPIINYYTINGKKTEQVSEIRDLGVMLYSKLKFNAHIEYVHKKAYTALNFVRRQSFYFDAIIIIINH